MVNITSATRSRATRGRAIRRVVLLSHGIDGGPGVAAEHARTLADHLPDDEIRVGCLRGAPTIEDATQDLDRDDIIVPVLMARGFIHAAIESRIRKQLHPRTTPPLGEHPRLPEIVRKRAVALAAKPSRSTLLLIGHGTTKHQGADKIVLAHAKLAKNWGFADVRTAFLDAPPFLPDVVSEISREAVAIGYFLDPGPHGIDDVQYGLEPIAAQVTYSGPIGGIGQMVPLIADLAAKQPLLTIA